MIFLLCIAKCNRSLAIDAIIYLCMAKKNPLAISGEGVLGKVPGSALLSHGGPHYHRRWAVSLPRSGWDRVVPARHGRQAILSPPVPLSVRGRCGALSGRRLVVWVSARFGCPCRPSLPSCLPWPSLAVERVSRSCALRSRRALAQAAWALYGQASRAISTG